MQKKDINEIKKLFTPDNCTVNRLRTCFVSQAAGGPVKKFTSNDLFLSLSEEEMHKYLAFFKKALSGTIGKTLKNLPFTVKDETEGTHHPFLMDIVHSDFSNEELIDSLYDKIIEGYTSGEQYCILLANAAYDVPTKASDETILEDSSDEVYNFMLCLICPVNLRDGELGILPDTDKIKELTRNMVLKNPDKAFLFPAFTDRSTDIHEVLYYSSKSKDLQPTLIDTLFGVQIPYNEEEQKYIFNDLITCAFGDDISLEKLQDVQEKLNQSIDDSNKAGNENVKFDKAELEKIFKTCGASDEGIDDFRQCFDEKGEKTEIEANNIDLCSQIKIKSPSVNVTIKKDASDRLEYKNIDGHKCLVIMMDDGLDVNELDIDK